MTPGERDAILAEFRAVLAMAAETLSQAQAVVERLAAARVTADDLLTTTKETK